MLTALLFAAAAHASCGPVSFAFVGQPACVQLTFDGRHTELVNTCDQPLLIDQSVLLAESMGPVLPPGSTTTLRDLNFFTLGMGGTLHRVVAVVEEPRCEEPVPAVPAPPQSRSWLQGVLGLITSSWPG